MKDKATIAGQLREMADRIERMEPTNGMGRHAYPIYAGVAYEVIHKINWGLANLHLDSLSKKASEIDVYQAELVLLREQEEAEKAKAEQTA